MKYTILFLLITFLIGCSKPIGSFVGNVDGVIENNELLVDCSDVINRNEEGPVAIGYLCNIKINGNTEITFKNGKNASVENLKEANNVKVFLDKPKDINEKNRDATAAKIIINY